MSALLCFGVGGWELRHRWVRLGSPSLSPTCGGGGVAAGWEGGGGFGANRPDWVGPAARGVLVAAGRVGGRGRASRLALAFSLGWEDALRLALGFPTLPRWVFFSSLRGGRGGGGLLAGVGGGRGLLSWAPVCGRGPGGCLAWPAGPLASPAPSVGAVLGLVVFRPGLPFTTVGRVVLLPGPVLACLLRSAPPRGLCGRCFRRFNTLCHQEVKSGGQATSRWAVPGAPHFAASRTSLTICAARSRRWSAVAPIVTRRKPALG